MKTPLSDLDREALDYHAAAPRGKIGIRPTKPLRTPADLARAYSPGVAAPCRAIAAHPDDSYRYTARGNLVAVVSDGSAVLGLGDIGAAAAKPVMEGKCLLLRVLAGVDAFDLEIDERDPEALIRTIRSLAPGFGAILLEDIRSPACFRIEAALRETLPIPVLHDDQHGTAVVVAAAVLNAAKIVGKRIDELCAVVSGAGAAAIASARMLLRMGLRRDRLVLCDSLGAITRDRPLLPDYKRPFATSRRLSTLAEAIEGADLFVGLSRGGLLTPDLLRRMAPSPVVLALANPDPELRPADAALRPDLVYATGRSDLPNQVNNALGMPFLFRAALDVRASEINDAMLLAAAEAIAALAEQPVPNEVLRTYNVPSLRFGRDYLLPKVFDPRLLAAVAPAVAEAAVRTGVARRPLPDPARYREELTERLFPRTKAEAL